MPLFQFAQARQFQLACLLIVMATAALYGPYVGNALVYDDWGVHGSSLYFAMRPFDEYSRTLPMFSVAFVDVIAAGAGLKEGGVAWLAWHRAVAIAIHATTACVLFAVFRMLAQRVLGRTPRDALLLGLWGALAFALHPVAVYAAGYFAQRTILFALLFAVCALYFYLRYLDGGTREHLLVAIFAAILAMFAKEHAVLVPVAVACVTPLYAGGLRASLRKALPFLAATLPFSLYMVWAMQQKVGLIGTTFEPYLQDFQVPPGIHNLWWFSICNQSRLFFSYAREWLLPDISQMSIHLRVPIRADTGLPYFLAFLAVGAAGTILVWKRRLAGLIGFGLLFAWTQFAVEMSSVRYQDVFVLYRSYLWAPGFILLAVGLLGRLPANRLVGSLTVAALVACAVQARDRLESMRTPESVWLDAKAKLPSPDVTGASVVYGYLALAYLESGRLDLALAEADRAVTVSPDSRLGYTIRSIVWSRRRENDKALADIDVALEKWHKRDVVRGVLLGYRASYLSAMGRYDEAKASNREARGLGITMPFLEEPMDPKLREHFQRLGGSRLPDTTR